MRIKELLEGKKFNDLDWIKKDGDVNVPNFDLAEDLMFFMNNDDDTYRRHVYPNIVRCIKASESKKAGNPEVFKDAVKEGYKLYVRKYPIRELPDEIDEKLCKETCEKFLEEVIQHISDGKYKD